MRYDCQFIYALRNPYDLQCFYVGRTGDIQGRIIQHKSKLKRIFVTEVLEYYQLNNDTVHEAEIYWIAEMRRRGYDLTNRAKAIDFVMR